MSSEPSLFIAQYQLGPMENFIYLLGDPATKEMAVVDPAWDVDFILAEAKRLGYQVTKIFLTHAHHDHVNGLNQVVERVPVPAYISRHEHPALTKNLKNLNPVGPQSKLKLGTIDFDVLHAPGHSPGCQCFLAQGKLICGDVLFIDGCGRCDLPGSNPKAMYNSLNTVILPLPEDTVLYPGHDYGPTPTDTLGHQKTTNPYLQCASLDEFLGERMGL